MEFKTLLKNYSFSAYLKISSRNSFLQIYFIKYFDSLSLSEKIFQQLKVASDGDDFSVQINIK